MITDTLEGRVKLAFANNKTDDEIAAQENISLGLVAEILKDSRLPLKITGIGFDSSVELLRVVRGK